MQVERLDPILMISVSFFFFFTWFHDLLYISLTVIHFLHLYISVTWHLTDFCPLLSLFLAKLAVLEKLGILFWLHFYFPFIRYWICVNLTGGVGVGVCVCLGVGGFMRALQMIAQRKHLRKICATISEDNEWGYKNSSQSTLEYGIPAVIAAGVWRLNHMLRVYCCDSRQRRWPDDADPPTQLTADGIKVGMRST